MLPQPDSRAPAHQTNPLRLQLTDRGELVEVSGSLNTSLREASDQFTLAGLLPFYSKCGYDQSAKSEFRILVETI